MSIDLRADSFVLSLPLPYFVGFHPVYVLCDATALCCLYNVIVSHRPKYTHVFRPIRGDQNVFIGMANQNQRYQYINVFDHRRGNQSIGSSQRLRRCREYGLCSDRNGLLSVSDRRKPQIHIKCVAPH